ncbi:MAG: MBL fold metallo-hydrolase [Thermoguttaceae bacterium]
MSVRTPVARFEVSVSAQCRIYAIPTQVFPHLIGYVYLLLGGDNFPPTLIDAGSGEGESTPQIEAGIAFVRTHFGESFGNVERILLTHAHVDHFGGAAELAAHWNATVAVHSFDAAVVAHHDASARVFDHRARRFLCSSGVPNELVPNLLIEFGFDVGRTPSTEVNHVLEDGELIDGAIRVHHVPGHSPGHVCFEVGEFLVLGDHILSRTIPQLWPQTLQPMTGLALHTQSLSKVAAIANGRKMIGLSGHEDVIDDLPNRLRLLEQNRARRERRLLTLLEERPRTIFELTELLYTSGVASRSFMAMSDVAARLEHLVLLGTAHLVAEPNGVMYYLVEKQD